jgi:polyketide biosynthesis 3-hydroxy-3-methylglutaryl-CoA synthase-like enzyme PksG
MGATTMLSLASTIHNSKLNGPQRIGVFSYGSGCCSEFFSGVARPEGQGRLREMRLQEHLDNRVELSMAEYEELLKRSSAIKFGTRNMVMDSDFMARSRSAQGREVLFLKQIREFHREYEWVS